MEVSYPSKIQTAANALLSQPAVCTPALRQAVESYAGGLGNGDRPAQELPPTVKSVPSKRLCLVPLASPHVHNRILYLKLIRRKQWQKYCFM